MKWLTVKRIFLICLLWLITFNTEAQCAMCKVTAENSGYAKSLNKGILLLLFFPFITIALLGIYWLKNKKKMLQPNSRLTF